VQTGLRILALIIDCGLCVFSLLGLVHLTEWVSAGSQEVGFVYIMLWFTIFALWPFVYFGLPTALWGATCGKFLCRLKVHYLDGGFWRGFRRETFKLLTIFSLFGAFFCVFQFFRHGTTWYDNLCGTRVELKSRKRLTKTQKRFRKYMKNRRESQQ